MFYKYSMSIAQQLMPIYNIIVHKNKSNIALNIAKLLVLLDTNMPHRQMYFIVHYMIRKCYEIKL